MKIAILVPNACNPDYRVIKQAELFAASGHEVRVFCRHKRGLPRSEHLNGVNYVRRSIVLPLLLQHGFSLFIDACTALVHNRRRIDGANGDEDLAIKRYHHRQIIDQLLSELPVNFSRVNR